MLCSLRAQRHTSSSLWTRTYAISVSPPKIFPPKRLPRSFGPEKTYQYNVCMRILQSNTVSPLIFLQHKDFKAQRLIKLRRDIAAAAHRVQPSPGVETTSGEDPLLVCLRTGILGAALRDYPGVQIDQVEEIASNLTGPLAILSLPLFNPPQLLSILRALDRTVPPLKPKTPADLAKEAAEKDADPVTPGRRMKRMKKELKPELRVVGALIDGRVFLPGGVREVSGLPTLETLREQIVGLVSASGVQLAGVLGEAGGAKVARTLEGLKKGEERAT